MMGNRGHTSFRIGLNRGSCALRILRRNAVVVLPDVARNRIGIGRCGNHGLGEGDIHSKSSDNFLLQNKFGHVGEDVQEIVAGAIGKQASGVAVNWDN